MKLLGYFYLSLIFIIPAVLMFYDKIFEKIINYFKTLKEKFNK